jgi:hypothetical protein
MTTASDLADEFQKAKDRIEQSRCRLGVNGALVSDLADIAYANLPTILSALRRVEPGPDQPRPSVSEDICDAPSLRESPGKRAKPYRYDELFGILNRVGDMWTFETFKTRSEASAHLARVQRQQTTWDLSRHRVVPVKVTVSVSKRKDGSSPKTTDKGWE